MHRHISYSTHEMISLIWLIFFCSFKLTNLQSWNAKCIFTKFNRFFEKNTFGLKWKQLLCLIIETSVSRNVFAIIYWTDGLARKIKRSQGLWGCLKARPTSARWRASSRWTVPGLESRWQQQGAETRGRGQVKQEVTEPLTSCLLKCYQTHKSVSKCFPIYRPVYGPTSTSHEFSAAAFDLVRLQLPLCAWHQSKSVSSWTQI